jgi:hypothetical protein
MLITLLKLALGAKAVVKAGNLRANNYAALVTGKAKSWLHSHPKNASTVTARADRETNSTIVVTAVRARAGVFAGFLRAINP